MKTINERIKSLTHNQFMLITGLVLLWDGYLFMGWFANGVRNGANFNEIYWYCVPVVLVFVFAGYKDWLDGSLKR